MACYKNEIYSQDYNKSTDNCDMRSECLRKWLAKEKRYFTGKYV